MKKKFYKCGGLLPLAFVVVTFCLGITSCDNDEDLFPSENKETANYESQVVSLPETDCGENVNDSIGTFQFNYQGRVYISQCEYVDSMIVIKNTFVRSVYESLKSMKNVAIYVNPDMTLDFYDSEQDMYRIRQSKLNKTRATSSTGYYIKNFRIRVYEHAKGRKRGGKSLEFKSTGIQGNKSPVPLYVPKSYLAGCALDKAISSSETWAEVGEHVGVPPLLPGTLLQGQYQHVTTTFYENGDYTGRSLTFTEMSINYTHSHVDYFSSMGFNDLTSSFKVIYDNNL